MVRLRSSSDLPEPVVPATSKCGPSVCKSSIWGRSGPSPTGTASPGRLLFAIHRRAVSAVEQGRRSLSRHESGMPPGASSKQCAFTGPAAAKTVEDINGRQIRHEQEGFPGCVETGAALAELDVRRCPGFAAARNMDHLPRC